MNKTVTALLAFLGVIVFFVAITFLSFIGVWNALNRNYQNAMGGESHYAAALDIVPEKIKGAWDMSNQYLDHESKTFRDVAQARSGLLNAKNEYERMRESGADSNTSLLKQATAVNEMFTKFQSAAGLAINVQIERYPELKGADTTKQAMRTLEEGINEIKTALDDWITAIKDYNTYRGSAVPSMLGGFMSKFPPEIEYYKGERKKLDIDSLNPKK